MLLNNLFDNRSVACPKMRKKTESCTKMSKVFIQFGEYQIASVSYLMYLFKNPFRMMRPKTYNKDVQFQTWSERDCIVFKKGGQSLPL